MRPFFLISLLLVPVHVMAVTAVIDLFAGVNSDPLFVDQNHLQIRGAELGLAAPLDPQFDGIVTFAGHQHEAEFEWELHEAYLQNHKLIPRSVVKVGKFLLGVGRLNQSHQHDWPFAVAPRVHREFFADEVAVDTGVQSLTKFESAWPMELTLGVTNGYCYGHCEELGARPVSPLHYVRWGLQTGNATTGLNYWSRTDSAGERTWWTGVDWLWENSQDLVQIESYTRNILPVGAPAQVDAGLYIYYQRELNSLWTWGARLDLFSQLNRRFPDSDDKRENLASGLSLNATYKASAATHLRLGYTRETETQSSEAAQNNDRLELQAVFAIESE